MSAIEFFQDEKSKTKSQIVFNTLRINLNKG
jgi:hypothetical protein